MTEPANASWQQLSKLDEASFVESRRTLHWACQLIDTTARGYVAARPNDEHTSMIWSAGKGAGFRGHRTAHVPPRRLSINIAGSSTGTAPVAEIVSELGEIEDALPLADQSLETAFVWLKEVLGPPSQSSRLSAPSYDLPPHPVQDGANFGSPGTEGIEIVHWFQNADLILEQVRAEQESASPVVAWPHHFDIATLMDLTDPNSDEPPGARSINVGLSPGDDSSPLPYWYVTPWPHRPEIAEPKGERPELRGGGSWHLDGFFAAILTADELLSTEDGASQYEQVQAFITSAIEAAKRIVAES